MELPAHDHPEFRLARRVKLQRALTLPLDYLHAQRELRAFHARKHSLQEIVDKGLHFGGRGWMDVRASQIPMEITALAERVAALEPQVIVEFGTFRGGTLFIWSQLAQELIVSCDLRPLWREAPLFRQFPPPSSQARVEILTGDSHATEFNARLRKTLAGRPIDFLFLDGDHSLQGIQRDFDWYAPLVRPGGLIACHDIVPKAPFPQTEVNRFWERLVANGHYETETFVEDWDQVGYGIGVIRQPG